MKIGCLCFSVAIGVTYGATLVDDFFGPMTAFIRAAEQQESSRQVQINKKISNTPMEMKGYAATKADDDSIPHLPCFADKDCAYANGDWLCSTDEEVLTTHVRLRKEDVLKSGQDGEFDRPGSGALRRLQAVDRRRPPRTPRTGKQLAKLPPLPPSSSPLYDEHLRRSMWGVLRSAVTQEKMGVCVAPGAVMSVLSRRKVDSQQASKEGRSYPNRRPLEAHRLETPVEFSLPSILKKSVSSSGYLPVAPSKTRPYLMGTLGEFQCFATTKIGHYDYRIKAARTGADSSQSLHGAPLPGAFLIQYTPLMTLRQAEGFDEAETRKIAQSLFAYRLVAEPYEYVVPSQKLLALKETKDKPIDAKDFPERVLLHRLELSNALSALGELAGVAELHPNRNDPVTALLVYLDANHVRLLEPVVASLAAETDGLRLYMSFKEINNEIDMPNGVLPLRCDTVGEGSARVEISAFMAQPQILKGLEQIVWPPTVTSEVISVGEFLRSLKASTLDQTTCTVRVLCLE